MAACPASRRRPHGHATPPAHSRQPRLTARTSRARSPPRARASSVARRCAARSRSALVDIHPGVTCHPFGLPRAQACHQGGRSGVARLAACPMAVHIGRESRTTAGGSGHRCPQRAAPSDRRESRAHHQMGRRVKAGQPRARQSLCPDGRTRDPVDTHRHAGRHRSIRASPCPCMAPPTDTAIHPSTCPRRSPRIPQDRFLTSGRARFQA